MKSSRGRLGQYSLLHSVESLSPYLVETELFTEAAFYVCIEKYKAFVIQPVFGPGEVRIFSENSKFRIVSKTNTIICVDREEVYQHLVRNEIKQKYAVIKPIKMNCRYAQGNCHYFVTVHRRSATCEWRLHAYTEKVKTTNGRGIYKYFRREIAKVCLLAAKQLGAFFPACHTIVIEIVYDMKEGIWIHDTVLHYPRSKWSQCLALTVKSLLEPFIPITALLTEATFSDFLHRYHQVIIKPCYGQEGLGIVQISKTTDHSYEIHAGMKKMTKSTLEETYRFIEEHYLCEKYYVIQQRLPLATINDCPMDCRAIVQKVDSIWRATGKIVKVAGPGFFITNAAQELQSLENAIRNSNMPYIPIDLLEDEIDEICIVAAGLLEENKSGIKIIGFDIGITNWGDIWIIEGNDTPIFPCSIN